MVSELSAFSLFFFACPQQGWYIRSYGLNWLNLCKTSLANPDGLPWRMRRKTREQEILSKACSKKPSSDNGTWWWTTLPRSFSGYPEAMHQLPAATLETPHPLRYKLILKIDTDAVYKWLNMLEGYFFCSWFFHLRKDYFCTSQSHPPRQGLVGNLLWEEGWKYALTIFSCTHLEFVQGCHQGAELPCRELWG